MLKIYNLDQTEQWDKIVCSFEKYDTYWLSGYVKAFRIHGDGYPLLFYYENGETRGVNVVMKRDIALCEHFKGIIPENQYFDFSTPYGYGGWIIEGENIEPLFSEYEEWCKKNNIVSEFVRFHPLMENHLESKEVYEVIKLGKVITMDISSEDKIWTNLTSKNRNMVRKAQKSNIKIYNGRFPQIYEKFIEIYNGTMDKDQASDYYYFSKEFYQSILEDLPQNAQVFWADLDGKVIAASIFLMANGRMNYHLSGSLKEYSMMAPTNLILYEAALWGCSNGYDTLYLGGGVGSGEDGLYKFKKSFNRNDDMNHFYIGKKVFSKELYDQLSNMRKGSINKSFFPLYRA